MDVLATSCWHGDAATHRAKETNFISYFYSFMWCRIVLCSIIRVMNFYKSYNVNVKGEKYTIGLANFHIFHYRIDTSGFDFDDEPSSVRLTPRRTPGSTGLKGSAKKKTTNFENILASVRRQKKLELREKSRSRKDHRKWNLCTVKPSINTVRLFWCGTI